MMIATREVTYDVDGLSMVAHLAQPDGPGPWPAVLIGHDGVGLDEYQRQRADDLAAHGYMALAMDYHGGEVFFDRPVAMLARVMPLMADVERMRAIGGAALDILLALPGVDPDRIAALGYGAGGLIVLELARAGVPFKAMALVYPGLPDASGEGWTDVTGTLLVCTGSEDPLCTPEQLLTFGRALQGAGVDWRVNIYGGAKHAFWARPRKPDGSPAEGPPTQWPPCPASATTRSTRRVHGERCSTCLTKPFRVERTRRAGAVGLARIPRFSSRRRDRRGVPRPWWSRRPLPPRAA